jgi:hypothetical protein
MLAEQVQRVGERRRGGFVSGQQEDEHLVADLAVGQRVSLVLRVEQQPQEVLLPVAAGSAVRDDLVADALQLMLCAPQLLVHWGGPAPRHAATGERTAPDRIGQRTKRALHHR